MNIKLLTKQHLEFLSLKGGCTCLSESIHVKMPHGNHISRLNYTVDSKIFAKALFSQNFVKIKSSQNGEIIRSFTDIGKSCPRF